MLSIIVPVYNAEKYISQCIDSVLSQSDGNWELILVDDGSSDKSGEIIDRYAAEDKRITVLHQKNCGPSKARNAGIEIARGEWISFIDSDDYVSADYVSTCHGCDNDIVFFSNNEFQEGKSDIVKRTMRDLTGSSVKEIESVIMHLKRPDDGYEFFGYTWNKFFRRSIIDEYNVRFIDGLFCREDEFFTADYCSHVKSIQAMSTALYNYRVSDNGLTGRRKSSEMLLSVSNRQRENISYYHSADLVAFETSRFLASFRLAVLASRSLGDFLRLSKDFHALKIDGSVSRFMSMVMKIEYNGGSRVGVVPLFCDWLIRKVIGRGR